MLQISTVKFHVRISIKFLVIQMKTIQEFVWMANRQQGRDKELEEETVTARVLAGRQRTEGRRQRERECHGRRRLAGTECLISFEGGGGGGGGE